MLRSCGRFWVSPEGIAGRRLPPDPAYGAVQHPRKDADGRPGKRSATGRSLDAPVVREILGEPGGYCRAAAAA
ncbi:TPA: hypothetical protein NHT84_002645 [Raoultella ornithinolytica]|nr:hypothetical protein CRN13_18400 [Raoultella ornithinolytica]HBK6264544.1 hypothetical protein [Raoultella ornithinolytica]HCH7884828.1 hypothetical protein [Raoultella ornithinolytica]HEF9042083.1 hypothetical protein [Raoultella ornithinolytica]